MPIAAKPASITPASRLFSRLFCLLLLLVSARAALAQQPVSVRFDQPTRVFHIDAADTSYVIGINEHEQVQALYWGK